jgi:hypothetical protein
MPAFAGMTKVGSIKKLATSKTMRNKTMRNKTGVLTLSVLCSALFASGAFAADPAGEPGRSSGKKNPLNNVYFGEQHLHTANSPDAFSFGTRNLPDDSYRYCKGEAVKKSTGGDNNMVKRITPYDWCAVTDHAVFFGFLPLMLKKGSPVYDTEMGKLIRTGKSEDGEKAFDLMFASVSSGKPIPYMTDKKVMSSVWEEQKATANKHNDPGKFTTLIAFEWTSVPFFQNLHHNVFFRDDKGPEMIFSALDSVKREDLWTYQEVQRRMGHENFSIPHNSNLSNSMMFPPRTSYGTPIDKHWAERSQRNTIAVEITQTKGTSETHPALAPDDEFASFETEYKHLIGTSGTVVGKIDHSTVRRALTDGVGFQEMIGANPYKLGIVAGADSHTGFSVNEENNYSGSSGHLDATPKTRLNNVMSVSGEPGLKWSTAGTTAVWAPENTRTAIFDGMKRKETYGTSGTLIRLRFFGGWDYADDMVKDKEFIKKAYADGVPMGGDLPKKTAKAPTFAVWALKDPESGNLDRIQIIKGWYNELGHPQEKVYDVVWSDNRKADPNTGKVPPVGNTVDIKKATYKNTIGDTQLSAVWTDPDFDPAQHAVYYARAIEIPTPRWTTYDAAKLGVEPPKSVPATLQERAWSSPIWYTADSKLVKKLPFYPGLQQMLP